MSNDECRERIARARSTAAFYGIVAVFTALSLLGCRPAGETSTLRDSPDEAFTDVAALVSALRQYADTTGALPGSKEVLQDFCSKENLRCANLDWSKFSWKTATNDSITITYQGDGYSLPITMTIGSASRHESAQVEGELKKRPSPAP